MQELQQEMRPGRTRNESEATQSAQILSLLTHIVEKVEDKSVIVALRQISKRLDKLEETTGRIRKRQKKAQKHVRARPVSKFPPSPAPTTIRNLSLPLPLPFAIPPPPPPLPSLDALIPVANEIAPQAPEIKTPVIERRIKSTTFVCVDPKCGTRLRVRDDIPNFIHHREQICIMCGMEMTVSEGRRCKACGLGGHYQVTCPTLKGKTKTPELPMPFFQFG